MRYIINYKNYLNMQGGNIKDYCKKYKKLLKKKYKYIKLYNENYSTKGCIFKVSNDNVNFEIIKIMTKEDYDAFNNIYIQIINNFGLEYLNSIHPKIYGKEDIEKGKYIKLKMEYFGDRVNDNQLESAKYWLNETLKKWHSIGIVHGDILEETISLELSSGRYKINKNNILFNKKKNEFRLIDFDSRFKLEKEKELRKKIFEEKHAPGRPKKKPKKIKSKDTNISQKLIFKKKNPKTDDESMLYDSNDEDFLWK
jgi:hypothetical protein